MFKRSLLVWPLLFSAPAVFASDEMTCYAEHPDLASPFAGIGVKFIPVKKAIAACEEAAKDASVDPGLCRITFCEAAPDGLCF